MTRSEKTIWVCEYSATQNCVHVMSLDTAVGMNLRQVLEGGAGDWIPVGAFDSSGEAHAMADLITQRVVNRRRNRNKEQ